MIAERSGLRSIYIISTVIFAVSTILIFFIRKQPVEAPEPHTKKFDMLRNNRFVLSLGLIAVITFATYLPQPLTSNFLQNERGLSLSNIGQLGTVMNISNVVFLLLLGHIPVISAFVIGEVAMIGFTLLLLQVGLQRLHGLHGRARFIVLVVELHPVLVETLESSLLFIHGALPTGQTLVALVFANLHLFRPIANALAQQHLGLAGGLCRGLHFGYVLTEDFQTVIDRFPSLADLEEGGLDFTDVTAVLFFLFGQEGE